MLFSAHVERLSVSRIWDSFYKIVKMLRGSFFTLNTPPPLPKQLSKIRVRRVEQIRSISLKASFSQHSLLYSLSTRKAVNIGQQVARTTVLTQIFMARTTVLIQIFMARTTVLIQIFMHFVCSMMLEPPLTLQG